MQKSVLVPIEKYQRLLENSTTNIRETRDASTETQQQHLEAQEEEKEEKTDSPTEVQSSAVEALAEADTPATSSASIQVSEHLDQFQSLKKPIKKRQRRSRPPGTKDYKSMWIKLNGRL